MTEEKIVEIMTAYIKAHDTPSLIKLVIKAIEKAGGKE